MRRNIVDKKSVNYIPLIFLFLYLPLCSIYPMISPLLAISFFLFEENKDESFYVLFLFLILFFFDIGFGFTPFSSIIFFLIINSVIIPYIVKISPSAKITVVLKTLSVYIGYLVFSFLLSFLLDLDFLDIDISYFLTYIVIDSLIALVYFNE